MDSPKRPSDSLPLLISDLASAVEREWASQLDPYGLGPAEFRILAICMEEPNCTATRIAMLAPVDPSSISRTVQRLVEKNLIARRRSQSDRRLVALNLTDNGVEMVLQLAEILQTLENRLVMSMSTETVKELYSLNTRIGLVLRTPESPGG